MKILNADIKITTAAGKVISFSKVNACKVVSSLFNLTDTCTITLGRKRKWKDENVTDLTEIIKRGDAIEVKMGYGDAIATVFKGYLTQVKTGTPVTIECENEAWKLKQMPIANKYYESLSFNSLMVRLKETLTASILKSHLSFNSLMVRLKVFVSSFNA